MASKSCISCLRAIQRQSHSIAQTRRIPSQNITSRSFTSSIARYAGASAPSAPAATSNPSVAPVSDKNDSGPTLPTFDDVKPKASFTDTYYAYGTTDILYQECALQADYTIPQATEPDGEVPKTEAGEDLGVGTGWWHTELGLKPTFSTWSQVTMLHMYLLSARLRNMTADPQIWQQHLLDHFSYDAENRMTVQHNMHARGTRNKYLKDLFIQWRGLLAAYDEGIAKGDAVLAAAVWRNVFKADENIDIKGLALVVSYMRRTLKGLDALRDDELIDGEVGFSSPKAEESVVRLRSAMMDKPFEKASGKDLPAKKK